MSSYWHNKGQQHGSKRKYNPPHSRVEDLVRHIVAGESKKERRERKAYDNGYGHSKRQRNDCFLTTACVTHAGLSDTCRELTVLRQFRDTYLARLPHGASMIAEYYEVAPRIVASIERSPQRAAVLGRVLSDVRRAVSLIERGDHESALEAYRGMFTRLQTQFEEQ